MQEELESKIDQERSKRRCSEAEVDHLNNQLREERNEHDAHEKEIAQTTQTQRGQEEEKAKRTIVHGL